MRGVGELHELLAEEKGLTLTVNASQSATIKGNPQITLLEVQGHIAKGEKDRLATSRAGAVVEALVQRGVDRTHLVAHAFGRAKPLCAGSGEECLARNRRG